MMELKSAAEFPVLCSGDGDFIVFFFNSWILFRCSGGSAGKGVAGNLP